MPSIQSVNLFHSDAEGINSVYYQEFLDILAEKNGWTYSFKDMSSMNFTESREALAKGELDFIYGAYKSYEEKNSDFLFSSIPCGYETLVVVARQDDARFNISDYNLLEGATIGFDATDPFARECVKNFEDDNGFRLTKYYFENSRDLLNQLKNGSMDLCLISLSSLRDDVKVIHCCDSMNTYFESRDPSIIKSIDEAMEELFRTFPFLFMGNFMESTGYPLPAIRNLTEEQKAFAAQKKSIDVYGCLAAPDERMKQVQIRLWNKVEQISGLNFNHKTLDDLYERINGTQKDELSSVFLYETWYNTKELNSDAIKTNPLYSMEGRFICNPLLTMEDFENPKLFEQKFNGRTPHIAVSQEMSRLLEVFDSRIPTLKNADFYILDDPLKCLEAVNAGNFDAAIINDFYLMKKYTFADFKKLKSQESRVYSIPVAVAVESRDYRERQLVADILNGTYTRLPYNYYSSLSDSLSISMAYVAPRRIRVYRFFSVSALVLIMILLHTFINMELRAKDYKKQLRTDETSGLLNSRGFEEQLLLALQQNPEKKYAITQFRIRGFSSLTKLYGMEATERLIQTMASQLSEKYNQKPLQTREQRRRFAFRKKEHSSKKSQAQTVGRYYNEVFCIFQPLSITEDQYVKSLAWFQDTLQETLCHKMQFNLVIKTGTAFSTDQSLSSIEEVKALVSNADYACMAKNLSMLDNLSVFDDSLRLKRDSQEQIETRIQEALKNEEFSVVFQPKVEISSGKLKGAEALVRWDSISSEYSNPERFIAVLERNGYIDRLDFYVYRKTFEYMQDLLNRGIPLVPVSLNVSRQCYDAADFVERFNSLFLHYSIPEKYIELEIEERFASTEAASIAEMVNLLHQKGFKVSMDDFGTGASSLNMLSEIPVDTVKFDRGFLTKAVTSRDSKIILGSLMSMLKQMGVTTLCEGIETQAQLEILKKMDCDLGQGYLFSRPVTMEIFEGFLKNGI